MTEPGSKAICAACGAEIVYIGPYWDHVGENKPRHPAQPVNEPQPPMEDEIAFGKDAWVYCRQHMRAHQTGWCSVSPRDKIGLGVATAKEAIAKCREWGLELYRDKYPNG